MHSHRQHNAASNRLPGLDILRCLAALLIFVQHTLSSCHYDTLIDVAGFRIGRIGTAVFFLLGGYLCARSSRKPAAWLKDRLVAIFPSYWIITAVGFGIAAVVRNKPFDTWQVVCQFAGVGYLTHGDRLINVATWFITPLLFFYGIAAILRLVNSRLANLSVVMAFVGLAAMSDSGYTTALCHGATFFAAFALSSLPASSKVMNVLPAVCFAGLCFVQAEFRYAFVASLMLLPAIRLTRGIGLATRFTSIAYEWFLVHGIVLTGASRLFANPLAAGIISIPLSLMFAWMLKQSAAALVQRLHRPPAMKLADSKAVTRMQTSEAAMESAILHADFGDPETVLGGPKAARKNRDKRPVRV